MCMFSSRILNACSLVVGFAYNALALFKDAVMLVAASANEYEQVWFFNHPPWGQLNIGMHAMLWVPYLLSISLFQVAASSLGVTTVKHLGWTIAPSSFLHHPYTARASSGMDLHSPSGQVVVFGLLFMSLEQVPVVVHEVLSDEHVLPSPEFMQSSLVKQ